MKEKQIICTFRINMQVYRQRHVDVVGTLGKRTIRIRAILFVGTFTVGDRLLKIHPQHTGIFSPDLVRHNFRFVNVTKQFIVNEREMKQIAVVLYPSR